MKKYYKVGEGGYRYAEGRVRVGKCTSCGGKDLWTLEGVCAECAYGKKNPGEKPWKRRRDPIREEARGLQS